MSLNLYCCIPYGEVSFLPWQIVAFDIGNLGDLTEINSKVLDVQPWQFKISCSKGLQRSPYWLPMGIDFPRMHHMETLCLHPINRISHNPHGIKLNSFVVCKPINTNVVWYAINRDNEKTRCEEWTSCFILFYGSMKGVLLPDKSGHMMTVARGLVLIDIIRQSGLNSFIPVILIGITSGCSVTSQERPRQI